jgi:hypothetical protein
LICPLWSNDRHFHGLSHIKVYDTKSLIGLQKERGAWWQALELAPEGQDPAQPVCSRVQLGGGLRLVALEGVELGLATAMNYAPLAFRINADTNCIAR